MKYICGIVLTMLLTVASAQDNSRPTQPDLPGDLMLDYGFSYWNKRFADLPAKVGGSNTVSLYYNRRFELNSHLAFHPGVGLSFDKYAFSGDYTWRLDNTLGLITLDTINGITLSKNKLTATYFEIPLELRYHPLGTVKGEGWFIGVGGIAGLRLSSHTKIKYDTNSKNIKENTYDDFNLKTLRYGLQFRFGFRNIHFYYKLYLSDVFTDSFDTNGRIPRASTIGINISGF